MGKLLNKINELLYESDEVVDDKPFFKDNDSSKRKLKKKIKTLECENEVLKESIKDELYKTFMEKLGEPLEVKRLRTENKNLRKKVKTLQEIIKGDNKEVKVNVR